METSFNFYVKVSGSSSTPNHDVFYINSGENTYIEKPTVIQMCEWKSYYFYQEDTSNAGHDLRLSETYDGPHQGGGQEYTDGVSTYGTPGSAGAYTKIDVKTTAAAGSNPLYYYCANHSGMGDVVTPVENPDCLSVPVWWAAESFCSGELGQPQQASLLFKHGEHQALDINAVAVKVFSGGHLLNHLGSTGCFGNVAPAILGQSGHADVVSMEQFDTCGSCASGAVLDDPYPCTIESALSGVLTGVIHSTNEYLSGEYETHTIQSYSIETGYNDGQFLRCHTVATGSTQVNAENRANGFAHAFIVSGQCYNETYTSNAYQQENTNNASIQFNSTFSHEVGGIWYSHASGFASREYWVKYNPIVSGNKTAASVEVNCPETDLQVKLSRGTDMWTTTGHAVDQSESITSLTGTLHSRCSGFKTSLTVDCDKVQDGIINFCEREFTNRNAACWEGIYHAGNYLMTYDSGSFFTSGDKYFIGTGELSIDKFK